MLCWCVALGRLGMTNILFVVLLFVGLDWFGFRGDVEVTTKNQLTLFSLLFSSSEFKIP